MSGTVRIAALALWCGVAMLLPELIARLAPAAPTPAAHAAPVQMPPARLEGLRPSPGLGRDREAPDRTDLHGNEIVRPVASYRLDRRGTLYEVHSPQTELPRLKAPVT